MATFSFVSFTGLNFESPLFCISQSETNLFRARIAIGSSIFSRLQLLSHGWVHTLPHTTGKGFLSLIKSKASWNFPSFINAIYPWTSIPAGQASVQGEIPFIKGTQPIKYAISPLLFIFKLVELRNPSLSVICISSFAIIRGRLVYSRLCWHSFNCICKGS